MSADFWQFAFNHPILTWLMAWGIWPVCWCITSVFTTPFTLAFKAYNRHLRSANIRANGWPKHPNMDADGDLVFPESKSERPA